MFRRAEVWDPALRVICERHNLPFGEFTRFNGGSHIVYMRRAHMVVKLYSPIFVDDYPHERLVLERVFGRIGAHTPEVIFQGELEGWPYLGLSFVRGAPIGDVWQEFDGATRLDLSQAIGELMARWHGLPTDGLDILDVDWSTFVRIQCENAVERQRQLGLGEEWLWQISEYLTNVDDSVHLQPESVLLNADLTGEHILVTQESGRWRLSGLVDFGDSMLGHHEYEFVAPGLDIILGDGECQRIMLRSYGYAIVDIDDELRKRLMAWTFLHRYSDVCFVMKRLSTVGDLRTLDELTHAFWSFQ